MARPIQELFFPPVLGNGTRYWRLVHFLPTLVTADTKKFWGHHSCWFLIVHANHGRYREDSSSFEIPYFAAKAAKFIAKFVAKVRRPDVAAASHPVLIPVKLSSQP
ncbi:hypothetical protein AVEN_114469-1 [Araneus ventricosus]|uniref:Uncharacterized protein n=1 Tax=Araneus ventricosus TaxID=182803 RepID=A0A4Y2AVA0_ARAVE|nr:hypothetical protein AVEN_114469-1 [Araneus ventricosus]